MNDEHEQANAAAKRGDFRLALVQLEGAPSLGAERLRVRCALAGLQGFSIPHPQVFQGASGRETLNLIARSAFVRLEGRQVAECQAMGRAMAGSNEFIEALAGLARAQPAEVHTLIEQARSEGRADALIDATALAAMSAALSGDLNEATDFARRASRMAAAEEMPQCLYFANLVLARVRRLTGRPHHACRILFGLARVVPPGIRPWLEWELAMNARLAAEVASGPGADLKAVLEHASRGDRGTFESESTRLDETLSMEWLRHDLEAVRAACDFQREPPAAMRTWALGEVDAMPHEVFGVATHSGPVPAEVASAAYVTAGPRRRARRIVSLGLPISGEGSRLDPEKGRAGRVETLIADLALAGSAGRRVPEAFQTVYRFAYESTPHSGVLRVLLHRARARLEGVATIERDGDVLRLTAEREFSVHDPRCEHRLEDVVLRMVAAHKGVGAKDVALALGVPLSTVQKTLRQLAVDGEVRKAPGGGRRIEYHVEDTTFAEPTTHFDLRDPRRTT